MGKQPTTGQKKTKDAIARAAAASRKGQKKKWSKGKVKDKLNLEVFVTPTLLKELEKELPKMRLITLSGVADKFKLVLSVARRVLKYFAEKKKILPLDYQHQQCPLYTGAEKKERGAEEVEDKKKKK
jgi:small subunit ribosomal protein S25e